VYAPTNIEAGYILLFNGILLTELLIENRMRYLYIYVLSKYLPGRCEENHEIPVKTAGILALI
jgi:hypothetical protein